MHHFRIGKKNSTQCCTPHSSIELRKAPIVRNVIYNNVSLNFRVLFQATMGRNKKDPATTGAAAQENADEEDRQRVRDEGATAWYEASEEEKERRKDVGAAEWENAVEEDRQRGNKHFSLRVRHIFFLNCVHPLNERCSLPR